MIYNTVDDIVQDLEMNPVERGGHSYQPIPFPEFAHLTTSSVESEARRKLQIIINAIRNLRPAGLSGARVLDIGANAGFHTFSLAELGSSVTAFEPHPRYAPIGEFLASSRSSNVTWHGGPFDPSIVKGQTFDCALMLSVFQWMADGGKKLDEASASLKAISSMSRTLIFELGFNNGTSCIKTNRLNHYAEIISFLRSNTEYDHFRLLGITKLWTGAKRFLVLCSNDSRLEDTSFRKLFRRVRI